MRDLVEASTIPRVRRQASNSSRLSKRHGESSRWKGRSRRFSYRYRS
jgi:hypothetical protein